MRARMGGVTDSRGDLRTPLLVNHNTEAETLLTHRKKIQMLRRSARELTRVKTSLVDAMATR